MSEHGEDERHRFTGTRLGDTDDVAARHNGRNRLCLNRSRSSVLEALDHVDTGRRQTKVAPLCRGLGRFGTAHLDVVELEPEVFDLLFSQLGDFWRGGVERLAERQVVDLGVVGSRQLSALLDLLCGKTAWSDVSIPCEQRNDKKRERTQECPVPRRRPCRARSLLRPRLRLRPGPSARARPDLSASRACPCLPCRRS